MAQDRATGIGFLLRSFLLAFSPAQLVLAFLGYIAFFLLNHLYFPDYDILRTVGGRLTIALDHVIGGLRLGDALYQLGQALRAFSIDGERNDWLVFLFYLTVWPILSVLFGAITRISAVRLGLGRKIGLRGALGFVARSGRFRAYFLPPLYFVAAFLVPVLIVGTIIGPLGRLSVGAAAVLYVLVFLIALLAVVIAVAGGLGFPLLPAAVSVDGAGSFDAVSRTCMYLFPRLPKYIFFCLVTLALGMIAILVVYALLGWAVDLSFDMLDLWWDIFGKHNADLKFARIYNKVVERFDLPLMPKRGVEMADGSPAVDLIGLVVWIIMSMVPAYTISYALSAGTITYMVLRRDEDGTPFNEIYGGEDAYEEELLDDVMNAHQPNGMNGGDEDADDEAKRATIRRGRR